MTSFYKFLFRNLSDKKSYFSNMNHMTYIITFQVGFFLNPILSLQNSVSSTIGSIKSMYDSYESY